MWGVWRESSCSSGSSLKAEDMRGHGRDSLCCLAARVVILTEWFAVEMLKGREMIGDPQVSQQQEAVSETTANRTGSQLACDPQSQ